MAILRLLCFPSTTSILTKQSNFKNKTNNILCTSSSSLFKSRNPIFKFHVSCSSSTSSDSVATENPELKEDEEEASRTRLIAQNVPWSSNAEDIRNLFEKHGTVEDVELSMHSKTRNRGLAFVTMGSPEEAAAAIEKLKSYEFEGRTLYVDYSRSEKKKPSPPEQPKAPSVYNLFVANLPFEARSKDLRELFQGSGLKVYSAEVIFHENPRKASGYGFVSFNSKEDANAALSAFQGKMLLGRAIRLARSKRFSKHGAKVSGIEDVSAEMISQQIDNADKT